jgi:hypothetical protein
MSVNPDNRIPEPPFTTAEAGIIGDTIGIIWDQVDFSVDQFLAGLQVELEHGARDPETDVTQDDPYETGKIAWAHLKEKPDYYEGLAAMEKANEPAAQAAPKDEGAIPMSPNNMVAPMDSTTQAKSAEVEKSAVVKRCRPTDCPDKPDDEKRWCLLTHDEKKALKCAPTREEAVKQEKNVNFFKHQGTTMEPRYTILTAAMILREAAQGRDVDDMDLSWDSGAIGTITKELDSAAIRWVQSDAFPKDDETFEMLDPVTDDRALPAKPDEYYPVFIKFCQRYGLDVEDLEKRWGGRSIDHRLTAVARDFAHKIVPQCTEQSRVCQDVGGAMAFTFVSRIPGVIYIAAETEGKQQFNFKPQLTRQYRDDKAAPTKQAGAKRAALVKRNRDLRVAVLVNVKSMWNPKFAEALQRSLTNLGDEPGQHPLDENTLEAQIPDTEVAREALNLYYTVWAATMETLYNFGKKVGNENVLNVTTARLSAAITDQAFGASKLMPEPPAQNLQAEYKQFIQMNKLTKGFDVNQIVQWATGTAGKTYKQWEKALTDRWKQEKPADKSTATPPPVPGGATPPPVPQDARKQKQGAVASVDTDEMAWVKADLDAIQRDIDTLGLEGAARKNLDIMTAALSENQGGINEYVNSFSLDGFTEAFARCGMQVSSKTKVKTAATTRVYFDDLGLVAVIKVTPESQAIMDEMTPHSKYALLLGDEEQFNALKEVEAVVRKQKLSTPPRGAKVQRKAMDLDETRALKNTMKTRMADEPAGLGGPLDRGDFHYMTMDDLRKVPLDPMAGDIGGVSTVTNQLPQGVDDPDVDLEIVDLLLGLGAQHDPDDQYTLMTPVGPLYCRVGHDALYCRFRDIEEALGVVDCDAHSGEWNQYYFDDESPEKFVGRLRKLLNKVMEPPVPMVQVTSPGMADMLGFDQPGPLDPDLGGLPDGLEDFSQVRGAGFLGVKPKTKKLQKAEAMADKALVQMLQEFGAQQNLDAMYDWELDTPVGKLGCTVRNGELFCRFDNPEAAALVTSCNPYSGKWNFHYTGKDPMVAVVEARQKISRLMDQVGQQRETSKIRKFVDKWKGAKVKVAIPLDPDHAWEQKIQQSSKSGMKFFSNDDATYVVTPRGTSWIVAVPGEQLEEPIQISAVPEDSVALSSNPVLDRLLTRFPRWCRRQGVGGRAASVKPTGILHSASLGLQIGFRGGAAVLSRDDGATWEQASKVDWDQVQLDCTAHRCEQYQEWPQEVRATFQKLKTRVGARLEWYEPGEGWYSNDRGAEPDDVDLHDDALMPAAEALAEYTLLGGLPDDPAGQSRKKHAHDRYQRQLDLLAENFGVDLHRRHDLHQRIRGLADRLTA